MGAAERKRGIGNTRHTDLVEGAAEERGEGRGKGAFAACGQADRRRDKLLLGDIHLEEAVREGFVELIGVSRVGNLAVQSHDIVAERAQGRDGIAIRFARGLFGPEFVHRQLQRLRRGTGGGGQVFGLDGRHDDMTLTAQFFEGIGGLLGIQGLAVPAVFVGEERDTVAFFGLRDDPDRLVGDGQGFGVGFVDGF